MWRNQRLASISLNKVIASLGSQKRVGLFLCVSVGITSTAGPVLLVPHQCQGGGGGGGGQGSTSDSSAVHRTAQTNLDLSPLSPPNVL